MLDFYRASTIERRAPVRGDARAEAYDLTERGRALDPVLLELARWGMSPMRRPEPDDLRRPAWYALALRAAFRPEVAGEDELYELALDGQTFHLDVRDRRVAARDGPAAGAAVRIEADVQAFLLLATGTRSAASLEREKRLRVAGERAALRRWLARFRLPTPA